MNPGPHLSSLVALAAVGVIAGLALLVRGFAAYRAAGRITGTAGSRIASLAVGEVLVSGTAEAIELTLVSPFQSKSCLYYRSRIVEDRGREGQEVFDEVRAVGFRVDDGSGTVRVFPSGARFDVPDRYDESTPILGGDPIGLVPRSGSAYAPGPGDRETQIAALLTVRDPRTGPSFDRSAWSLGAISGRRHYREARIEPGETVTVVGQVMRFGDLEDPAGVFLLDGAGSGSADVDPEIAADLAAARASGTLAGSADDAWGNAAIEGFGIGRPVRAPVLDPAADRPPPGDAALAARADAAFEIAPDALVLVASAEVPLLISLGAPATVAAREQWQFIIGLVGAVLAIGSAMTLGVALGGGL